MRKREPVLSALAVAMLLTGCSGRIQERAMEASGIYDDPGYLEYSKALENGEVVEDGEYRGFSSDAAELLAGETEREREKGVSVTMAVNSKLSVRWYTDRERTAAIEGLSAEVPTGTAIYADVSVTSEAVSDRYVFDGFRIITYSSDGVMGTEEQKPAADGLVCVVPSDGGVEAVSILPLGRYDDRVLALDAKRLTSDGTAQDFTGQWRVNSESVEGGNVRISSASEYTVEYDYRALAESYYLARGSAVPAAASDESGVVRFAVQSPMGGAESFSLLFRPYIRGLAINDGYKWLISEDIVSAVTVNGAAIDNVRGRILDLGDRLRAGDTVKLRVKSGYEVRAPELCVSGPVETDSGRNAEYTVTVPEDFYGFSFEILVCRRDTELTVPSIPVIEALPALFMERVPSGAGPRIWG